jgi:hypothetical protein
VRKVFISYRRSDAAFAAGALGRDLRARFGESQVFRDRENIAGGALWRDQVLAEIDGQAVMLVLIGESWLEPLPSRELSRLHDANDSVRIELVDGLKDGATLIPVLLENAGMPAAEQLPPEIRSLCDVNALRLRDGDWAYDVERIFKTLENAGFQPQDRASVIAKPAAAHEPQLSWKTLTALFFIAMGLMVLTQPFDTDSQGTIAFLCSVALALALWALVDIRKHINGGKWVNAGAIAVALVMFIGVVVQDAPPGSDDAPAAASTSDEAEPGQHEVPSHDPEQPGQAPEEPAQQPEQPADQAM